AVTARHAGDEVVLDLAGQRRIYSLPRFLSYYRLTSTRYLAGRFRMSFRPTGVAAQEVS
nr:hypothetical protein [Gemmatimonadota bacterium]NIQ55915.1 hypothetical protein [Gemmatimonadota bacterium]NIU76112.1 hypothetical protein [Gammaproteobacteria bacterium]NIX45665.1 hypothetical protein [Gemmatimonadota bacterium]NIY09966.1 hypothetical protein [Gemmatimonadota bacterium]